MLAEVQERAAMRETFARILSERCTQADVRRIMATEDAHEPDLWRAMAELGVLSTLVPEAFGGLGGSALEIEILMEEAGKALLPCPFLSSAVLATALVVESSNEAAKHRLLPKLAEGSLIGTAALAGKAGLWDGEDGDVVASGSGDSVTLDGVANYVSDGALADLLLVVAGRGNDRKLYEVTDRAGLSIVRLGGFDLTQRLANLEFSAVRARELEGANAAAIDRALDLVRIAKAGREAGAARMNFEFTMEYLRTRVQFGRPIGGFQAVKHMAADLLVEAESAISGARAAAEAHATGAENSTERIALASFAVNEAQLKIGFDSIQLHGGIGFTWEHPAHLYLRRARHDQMFLGSNDLARERFVTILEDGA